MENIVDFVENQVVIVSKDDLLKFGENTQDVYNHFMMLGKALDSTEYTDIPTEHPDKYLVLEGADAVEFMHMDYRRIIASTYDYNDLKGLNATESRYIRFDIRDNIFHQGLPMDYTPSLPSKHRRRRSEISKEHEDTYNISIFDKSEYIKAKEQGLSNEEIDVALVDNLINKCKKISSLDYKYKKVLGDPSIEGKELAQELGNISEHEAVKIISNRILDNCLCYSDSLGRSTYGNSFFNHFVNDYSIRRFYSEQEAVKHSCDLVAEGKEIEPNDLSCTIKVEQTPETAALDDLKEAKTYDFADTVNNMQRIVDVNNEIYEENKNKNEAERVNPKAQFQFNIKDKDKEFSLPATTQELGKTRLTMHDLMRGNVVKAYKWAFESIDNQFQKGLPMVVKGVEKSLNAAIKTLAVPGAVVLGSALVADSALKTTTNAIKYVSENVVQPIFHKVFNKANELSKRISNGIKAFNAEMKKDFKSFDPKDCIFIRLEEKDIEKLPNLKEKMQIFNAEDQVVMIKKKDFISLNSPELLDSQMFASFKDYMQGNKMGDELKASMARQIVPQIAVNKSKGR